MEVAPFKSWLKLEHRARPIRSGALFHSGSLSLTGGFARDARMRVGPGSKLNSADCRATFTFTAQNRRYEVNSFHAETSSPGS
jgi:hypothetical protein